MCNIRDDKCKNCQFFSLHRAFCPSATRVLCAVLCTAHSTRVALGHAATPPNNNFTEYFRINIILVRLNCKLADDGRRPKHAAAI